ncbi:hypothetical protein RM530_03895 [Algiphilus sp. W345]|uniref:Uncharacterized protein n=1 Tax=Banduia mediterranea TaxID=3075609 RepID=A0ABU2WF58_9GAMM|nr:hypothetical protein [Algiphilus sp. W345]MDT0496508.1 hypothetical protein [Algiphilus sp. W345]
MNAPANNPLDELHITQHYLHVLADLVTPERDLGSVNRDALACVLDDLIRRQNAALTKLGLE